MTLTVKFLSHNRKYEGWKPRSYPTLANALATAGITERHVVTRLIDVERLLAATMEGPKPVDMCRGADGTAGVTVARHGGAEHSSADDSEGGDGAGA